jgi:hypothetical protein
MTDVASPRSSKYRERLWPGALGWAIAVGAGVVTWLAFVPVNRILAVTTGAVVLVISLAVAIGTAPVIEVDAGELRAGRAHIPVSLLGEGVELEPAARRIALGRDLDARAYVCLRAWIPAMIRWDVNDTADATPYWLVSTRRPRELRAAVAAAQRLTV